MRILLIEDDTVLRTVLRQSLTDAGHRVDESATLSHAQGLWLVQPFDAVLLDLNLPDGSGLDALRQARRRGDNTPVLILSARDRSTERIMGLDAGADDYLGKPFDLAEVEARLRALVRRARSTHDTVTVGALALDRRLRRFTFKGQPLDLPAREFDVLWELMTPPNRVVSKRELSDKLSSFDEALGDNALETFISRLRKKIVDVPESGVSIRTLRGLGYMLAEANASTST